MTKFISTLAFLSITFCFYGVYLAHFDIETIPPQLHREYSKSYYDYRGVLNVHTDLSSGSSAASFVTASAKLANLDFIFYTDLNVFNNPTATESYHSDLLVFNGGKYSYLDSRLIYYSAPQEELGRNLGEAQVKLADIITQKVGANHDSMTILAHPYKTGFSWLGEIPSGIDGVEILNLKSLINRSWEESKVATLWSLFVYPFNPELAFIRLFLEPRDEIALWDNLSKDRPFVGYAGTEASARAVPLANYLVKFPSYKRSFEFMSNHVVLKSELTGNFTSDKAKIFNALKNGQFYLALDTLGNPKGFSAMIDSNGEDYLIGSKIKYAPGMVLKVSLPAKPKDFFEIIIYRNGEAVQRVNAPEARYEITQQGTYRVQVRVAAKLPLPDAVKWISWIYTNPFYIR